MYKNLTKRLNLAAKVNCLRPPLGVATNEVGAASCTLFMVLHTTNPSKLNFLHSPLLYTTQRVRLHDVKHTYKINGSLVFCHHHLLLLESQARGSSPICSYCHQGSTLYISPVDRTPQLLWVFVPGDLLGRTLSG